MKKVVHGVTKKIEKKRPALGPFYMVPGAWRSGNLQSDSAALVGLGFAHGFEFNRSLLMNHLQLNASAAIAWS